MTPDDLRRLMTLLQDRVSLAGRREIAFEVPTEAELIEAGFPLAGIRQLLDAPWLDEMVADVVETPEYCDADADAAEILRFARDAIGETLRKRYSLAV